MDDNSMTEMQWNLQRMFCKQGHVFNQDEALSGIIWKRCPVCNGAAQLVYLPKQMDKYLYINTDSKYYEY